MKMQVNRSYGLDALKVFATMAIVAHHFQQDFQISYDNHLNFYSEDEWFTWSYMVELFFLLSGYFMYKYVPKIINGEFSLSRWMRQRVQRLLPLVAVAAISYEILHVVYWNLHGTYWYYERPFSIWGIVVTSLGMHDGGALQRHFCTGWCVLNHGIPCRKHQKRNEHQLGNRQRDNLYHG